jgi:hypothetical protein
MNMTRKEENYRIVEDKKTRRERGVEPTTHDRLPRLCHCRQ